MSVSQLIENVIAREGGYVNNAADAGGPTKFGITQATLADWRKRQVSANDVAAMPIDEARDIYRDLYFTRPGLDAVRDERLQEFLFDYAVNSGTGAAVQALQRAIGATPDGELGPKSREALAKVTNMQALFYRLKAERYELLLRYVGSNPRQSIFAIGWANRLDQFEWPLS